MPSPSSRLLFIEDSAADAERMRTLLAEAPDHTFITTHVASVAAGAELLLTERFDAILLGLRTRDGGELQALLTLVGAAVQGRPGAAAIIAVADADGCEPGLRKRLLESGAQDLLSREEALSSVLWRCVLVAIERRRFQTQRRQSRELELSNQQIRERNRHKSDFLAKMSHELRTPLNAIIGFAQLLYDGEVSPDSPQHREFIGDILTSGNYLLKLINDVLDIAKVEAGRTAFRPETISLPGLVAEVCAGLRPLAADKEIEVEVESDPRLQEVVIDPVRFRQILQNYLANALRFTPARGHVTVRTLVEDADLFRLEVEDTGVGIDEQGLSQIFSEFRQVGSEAEQSGTGLGLAVTKRLVEAQGGSVGVRSRPGSGSVFHAVLPRQVGTASWPPLPANEATDPIGGVLILDNNPHTRRMIAKTVSTLGHAVIYRSSGPAGLDAVKKLDPVAVVVDIPMHGMDGFEFIYRMRGLPAHARTPIVVWTNRELEREERARLDRLSVTVMQKTQAGTQDLLLALRGVLSSQFLTG
jgi:signal transduction histidine kinase